MAEISTEVSERITITANRLRMVQSDFADVSGETRCRYMAEELRRGLAAVEPEDRQSFLEELRRRFSVLSGGLELAEAERALESDSVMADADLAPQAGQVATQLTPPQLAARLAEMAANLSLQQRQRIAQNLAQAGLVLEMEPQWDPATLLAVREALQIRGPDELYLERVLESFRCLAQFGCSLYQLTWSTWRAIAPHSDIRRGANLQKLLAKFVAGDADVTSEQVEADLDRLRQLIASLISAISRVGHQFAATHLARFTPAEVESAVSAEGPRGWSARAWEARCWRKYVELADTLDPAAIEAEVREVIVDHAEQLMKGLGRVEKR